MVHVPIELYIAKIKLCNSTEVVESKIDKGKNKPDQVRLEL